MAPYGSADQGMAEWSNNGDPDDYPPRWLSRALCKAGRVGVLDQVHNTLHPAPNGAFRAEPRTTRLEVSGRSTSSLHSSDTRLTDARLRIRAIEAS